VPDPDHAVRYIKGSDIDDGVVNGQGFLEPDASANWLEYFDPPLNNQVAEVVSRKRIKYGATGRLARLNVGHVRAYILSELGANLAFVHKPLEPIPPKHPLEDYSHIEIAGIVNRDSLEAQVMADLISHCVIEPLISVPKG